MPIELDHLILSSNDRPNSIEFYTRILGFTREPDDWPFAVLRVSPGFVLLLAPQPAQFAEHLAFSMSKQEFEATFRRIRDAGIPYGDTFDSVGSMRPPGDERGSRGMGKALYVFDPDKHLIEIRHYETG